MILGTPRNARGKNLRFSPTLVVAIGALVLALGGVAYATIPASGGVIHGCYLKRIGSLRVIDPSTGQHCAALESSIQWDQTGPQGPAGPTGLQGGTGPQGPAGASGPPGAANAVDTSTVQNAVLPFPIDWVVVTSLDLPQGHYLVNGSVVVDNDGYDNVTACRLFSTNNPAVAAGNEFGNLAQATVFNGVQGEGETTLPVSGLIDLPNSTTAALECLADPYGNSQPSNGAPAGHVLNAYMNAVTVSSVNGG